MATCQLLFYMWVGSLLFNGMHERVQLAKLVKKSTAISKGQSEDQVIALLGEPLQRWEASRGFFLIGSHPAQWIYGSSVDLEFSVIPELGVVNPLPVKLRLFSAAPDDLVIDWSKSGKVMGITRPTMTVTDGLDKLFEPIDFINHLGHTLLSVKGRPDSDRS